MLRPGRLDAIISIEPPDAETAERLVRHYGGNAIDETEDLVEVGVALQGQIPAVIEETVKRAKLYNLSLLESGAAVTGISAEALRLAGVSMKTQIELLEGPEKIELPTLDKAFKRMVIDCVKESVDERSTAQ